jgi:hypothetical protein
MKQSQRTGSKGAQVRLSVAGAANEVVARGHPDLPAVLEPHLGRAQHMAGRVQADAHAVVLDDLAIGQRLQRDLAQPRAQHAFGRGRGQVVAVAAARVVGMRVGDDGAITGRQGSM